jgi:DNA polymerase-3 subunit epsilon
MGVWFEGRALGFDTESTGVNVESDRIVTTSLVHLGDGKPTREHHIINPGVPIPAEASAIHGLTTEYVAKHGAEPAGALERTVAVLAECLGEGVPVVGMNCVFDFTLLDRECRRYDVAPLSDRLADGIRPVIDVAVLDKQVDRYRRGSRKLDALCDTYTVKHHGAHDSGYDALAAAQVAAAIGRKYPVIGGMAVGELHDAQVGWRAQQQAGLQEYFERKGQAEVCRPEWPLIPFDGRAVVS